MGREPTRNPQRKGAICLGLEGFTGGSDGKESACNAGDPGLIAGLGIPWRRKWQSTPVFLPGEFRSLVGYSPWGCKELDMTERLTLSLSEITQNFLFKVD